LIVRDCRKRDGKNTEHWEDISGESGFAND
jgi:hypothetical protein